MVSKWTRWNTHTRAHTRTHTPTHTHSLPHPLGIPSIPIPSILGWGSECVWVGVWNEQGVWNELGIKWAGYTQLIFRCGSGIFTHTHTLTLPYAHTHTHTHSLTHTHSHTLDVHSWERPQFRRGRFDVEVAFSRTHTRSHTHLRTHSHTHTLTVSHSLTHSLTLGICSGELSQFRRGQRCRSGHAGTHIRARAHTHIHSHTLTNTHWVYTVESFLNFVGDNGVEVDPVEMQERLSLMGHDLLVKVSIYTRTDTHTHTHSLCVYIYHTPTWSKRKSGCRLWAMVCLSRCIYTHTHIHTHTQCVYIYTTHPHGRN